MENIWFSVFQMSNRGPRENLSLRKMRKLMQMVMSSEAGKKRTSGTYTSSGELLSR